MLAVLYTSCLFVRINLASEILDHSAENLSFLFEFSYPHELLLRSACLAAAVSCGTLLLSKRRPLQNDAAGGYAVHQPDVPASSFRIFTNLKPSGTRIRRVASKTFEQPVQSLLIIGAQRSR